MTITSVVCPTCHAGPLLRGAGRLDQSGDSYLPTVIWRCAHCEYTRYEPAPHARWQPRSAPAAAAVEPAPAAPGRLSRAA